MKSLIKAYEVAEKLLRGVSLEELRAGKPISWNKEVEDGFVKWMEANGRSREYVRKCILYLRKYVRSVHSPEDVVGLFEDCKRGRHHLDRALRNLFNYYQLVKGYPEEFLNGLRKAIPRIKTGVDYREPSEDEVIKTFRELKNHPLKYKALYQLILDSGIRSSHALYLMNGFQQDNLERVKGFCKYILGLERGTKHSFYAYMREETAAMIKQTSEEGVKLHKEALNSFVKRHGSLTRPKLLRKFAYNKMILCGLPESVTDFLNGRKPTTVGGQHYMWLRTQADQHYPKYVNYLNELSKKIE